MILPPPWDSITLRHRLRKEKSRFQIDLQHVVPIGLGKINRRGAANRTGVVDQDVNATQLIHDARHGCLQILHARLAQIQD